MPRSAQEVSDKPFTITFTLSFRLFNHDYPVLIYLSLLLFNFEWANYSNNVDIRVNKKTLRELFRNLNIIKMHYFKNIQNVFCILLLCFTVNAQEWPIGRVSDGKVAMKISDCFLSLQEWQCPVRGKIWSSSKGKLWNLSRTKVTDRIRSTLCRKVTGFSLPLFFCPNYFWKILRKNNCMQNPAIMKKVATREGKKEIFKNFQRSPMLMKRARNSLFSRQRNREEPTILLPLF